MLFWVSVNSSWVLRHLSTSIALSIVISDKLLITNRFLYICRCASPSLANIGGWIERFIARALLVAILCSLCTVLLMYSELNVSVYLV